MNKVLSDKRVLAFILAALYWCNARFLDFMFFWFFNGHLVYTPWIYKYIFALLNHRYENMCDILLVMSTVIWVFMKYTRNRRSAAFFILALAIWYEIGFQIIHRLEDLTCITRHSPSLEYGVFFDLSEIHPLAKVYAQCSFPSGHAMIFGYFGSLSQILFPQHLRRRYFILSLLCCIPRLVSGAHSVSDILAGYALGVSLWISFLVINETIRKFQYYWRKKSDPDFSSEPFENHFIY